MRFGVIRFDLFIFVNFLLLSLFNLKTDVVLVFNVLKPLKLMLNSEIFLLSLNLIIKEFLFNFLAMTESLNLILNSKFSLSFCHFNLIMMV